MDAGIESTAHTLSFGLIDKNGMPFPSSTSTIKPEKGGIHPRRQQTICMRRRDCSAALIVNLFCLMILGQSLLRARFRSLSGIVRQLREVGCEIRRPTDRC